MTFESDFYAAMDVAGQTLTPGVAEQGATPPYSVWVRVFSERQNSLDGFTSGLEKVRVQLDCYADTFDGAVALATAYKAKADASVTMKILVLNEQDFFEDDTRMHRRMLELSCMHKS